MTKNEKIAFNVIRHAEKQNKKGKNPSSPYQGEKNPKKALALAKADYQKESKIPYITGEELSNRMKRIRFIMPVMLGVDGKKYMSDETDEKYFELFYVKNLTHPVNQSFNFSDKIFTIKAEGLKELAVKNIFVRIGGYYGFCKASLEEVMAQIPQDILSEVVAFTPDSKNDPQIIDEDYQSLSIVFYGQGNRKEESDNLIPSVKELIKPIDIAKVNLLKDRIKPILSWSNDTYSSIEPDKIDEPFMDIGIWMRINGSHLHRHDRDIPITIPVKIGERFSIYQALEGHADLFSPNYSYTISQIPDQLITEKTIGFIYRMTDYFKTKEGIVHKTDFSIVESN